MPTIEGFALGCSARSWSCASLLPFSSMPRVPQKPFAVI
jgi:hypothetical protein